MSSESISQDVPTDHVLVLGPDQARSKALATADIVQAIRERDLWTHFAWNDVLMRYRRSRLGQFWFTLSIAIFVGAIGTFYGAVLDVSIDEYLPFLSIGYVLWSYLVSITAEGSIVFVSSATYLSQHRIPLSVFVLRCVQRNMLIFMHNALVVVFVLLIFPQGLSWSLLTLIPAFAIWYVCSCWLVMFLGLIAVRFRDVTQIVANIMQIAFFLTPVIWQPSLLKGNTRLIADLNPFAHFLAIIREPLMGNAPDPVSWVVCIVIATAGAFVTFLTLVRVRSRVPYWL
ncbi:MAG: ABC transporter permease [Rhizobiaceae bacterium]